MHKLLDEFKHRHKSFKTVFKTNYTLICDAYCLTLIITGIGRFSRTHNQECIKKYIYLLSIDNVHIKKKMVYFELYFNFLKNKLPH